MRFRRSFEYGRNADVFVMDTLLEFLVQFSTQMRPFISQGTDPKARQYIVDPTFINFGVNVT